MTTPDRALLRLATRTLTLTEFAVWFAHHYRHLGRPAGAQALGISENAWRWRLDQANRKLDAATHPQETP